MKSPGYWLLLAFCGIGLSACGRDDRPVSQAPATQPFIWTPITVHPQPATQPASSTLAVDDQQEFFPPAMLRVSKNGRGEIVARLYSDDPHDVLEGEETVNSYDFQMKLTDIDDPANISNSVWTTQSASLQKQDSPYGIFLNTQHELLQPMDVTVHFIGQTPHVMVRIGGTFAMFKTTDDGPRTAPVMVRVIGALQASVPQN